MLIGAEFDSAALVLAPVVVRCAARVRVQDHPAAAVPARPCASCGRGPASATSRPTTRPIMGATGVDGFLVTTGWGTWGFKAIPAGGEAHGRADRHGPAAGAHRAVRARPLPARPRPGRPGLGGDALMLWLDCPRCGRRPLDEFTFGGERRPRPDVDRRTPTSATSTRSGSSRTPTASTTERWFHAAGCRRWLTVRRDTSIDAVVEVR